MPNWLLPWLFPMAFVIIVIAVALSTAVAVVIAVIGGVVGVPLACKAYQANRVRHPRDQHPNWPGWLR